MHTDIPPPVNQQQEQQQLLDQLRQDFQTQKMLYQEQDRKLQQAYQTIQAYERRSKGKEKANPIPLDDDILEDFASQHDNTIMPPPLDPTLQLTKFKEPKYSEMVKFSGAKLELLK